MRDHKSGPG